MKIDSATVRSLREQNSWSQEHLASAAGLSTRTVQRVEADGIGSAETRLALAGALGVAVSQIASKSGASEPLSLSFRRGRLWGWIGWCAGGVAALAAITLDVTNGGSSMAQSGAAVGVVCAGLGISAAVLGHLQSRARTRGAAA
ncbi:helix-turn-helix transcriptional regulator [Luteimonas sp. A611]